MKMSSSKLGRVLRNFSVTGGVFLLAHTGLQAQSPRMPPQNLERRNTASPQSRVGSGYLRLDAGLFPPAQAVASSVGVEALEQGGGDKGERHKPHGRRGAIIGAILGGVGLGLTGRTSRVNPQARDFVVPAATGAALGAVVGFLIGRVT